MTHCLPKNEWSCKPNPNSLPNTSWELLTLTLFLTPLNGFSPFSWWPLIFQFSCGFSFFGDFSTPTLSSPTCMFISTIASSSTRFIQCWSLYDLHVAPAIFAPLFIFLYFAIFLQDHYDVVFNPTSIFDRSKLSPSLIQSNRPRLWHNKLYRVHDQAECVLHYGLVITSM